MFAALGLLLLPRRRAVQVKYGQREQSRRLFRYATRLRFCTAAAFSAFAELQSQDWAICLFALPEKAAEP